MQAVKLTIPGAFWDVQIYRGRLYLFLRDGSVTTINWDRLIDEWRVDDALRLPLTCAFQRSDYLYGDYWPRFFQDTDVKSLILDKFARLSQVELTIDLAASTRFLRSRQESPFPFPHSDSRIYARKVFVGTGDGAYSASCGERTVRAISSRVQKLWDGPVLALSASSMTLAIAAGDQGLFETRIGDTDWEYLDEDDTFRDEVRAVAAQPCEDCEWAFGSIFASSHDRSYLARFQFDGRSRWMDRRIRSFKETVPADEIFGHVGYSWARRSRIVQSERGVVRVAKFDPRQEGEEELQLLTQHTIASDAVVSGGVAVFGTIVESDDSLEIVETSGNVTTIRGEPVRWRVYPRSKHYENHLHIIYSDRLEVWSFNHDYFVDQKSKAWGVPVY